MKQGEEVKMCRLERRVIARKGLFVQESSTNHEKQKTKKQKQKQTPG